MSLSGASADRPALGLVALEPLQRSVGDRLRGTPFTRFVAATTCSFYGDWLTTVAVVVLVYRVAGTAVAPAGYMLARVAPRLVGPLVGGALADRFGASRVVAVSSLLQGALTAAIIPAAHARLLWAIYAAVALAQVAGSTVRPAHGALLPRLVPESRLDQANGLYMTLFATSILVSPALAVPLLALTGPDLLLLIDVGTFIVAAGLMLTLPYTGAATGEETLSFRSALVGLGVVRRDPFLRALVMAHTAPSGICVTAAQAVLVVAAADRYGGEGRVGALYAAVGAGAVIAGLFTLRVRPRAVSRSLVLALSLVELEGVAVLVAAPVLWAAMIGLAVSSGAAVFYQVWGIVELQRRTPRETLGRVSGVIVLGQFVGMLVGACGALALVPLLGWSHALLAMCCLGLALLVLPVLPARSYRAGGREPALSAWTLPPR